MSDNPTLVVTVLREPYIDIFTLVFENGESEDMEPDETRDFFKKLGANMFEVEKALDYCWNFYKVIIAVDKPNNFDLKKLTQSDNHY